MTLYNIQIKIFFELNSFILYENFIRNVDLYSSIIKNTIWKK